MTDAQPAQIMHKHMRGQYHLTRPDATASTLPPIPYDAFTRTSGTTTEFLRPTALTDTIVLEAWQPEFELWYRLNSTWPDYLPVTSRHQAESLLRQIHDDEPWVNIAQPDPGTSTYFQVLGTPDRLTAEAGFCLEGVEVSCRFTALPRDDRDTHVGPHWYQLTVRESDILTIHDALGLLCPTLAGKFRRIGGIIPVWFT